jgi:hypothetical protein
MGKVIRVYGGRHPLGRVRDIKAGDGSVAIKMDAHQLG